MKKLLFLIAFFLWVGTAEAARVVSDPYLAPAVVPDYFTVSLNGGSVVQSRLTGGNHEIKVKACKDFGAVFGVRCSDEAVFTFAVPAAPAIPSGLKLSQ